MFIAHIVIGSIIILGLLYILLGVYTSYRINFIRKRTEAQIIHAEWNENIPYSELLPPAERIYLQCKLGYLVAARFFPAPDRNSHKYMLLLHGYNNCSVTCGKYALIFNARGFNCIAPDLRRHGDSNGRGVTFGYYERVEAEQWIEEIYKMDPKAEIGLFGISMGAATAILTASVRADIRFLISYCSFSNFKNIFMGKGAALYSSLIKLIYPAFLIGAFLLTGARMDYLDIAGAIKHVTCPTLIMHSRADAFSPYSEALALKEAKPDAELKTFENSVHARAYSKQPELYKQYLNEFLDKIGY